jgi:cytochrome c biogenesis protein ResB
VGSVLLANLIAAHITRFKMTRKKVGILMIHFGVILLLLGQLLTDMLSTESAMKLQIGETKSFSEDFHDDELVLVDTSDANVDRVISVPDEKLAPGREVRLPSSPFAVRVKKFWANSDVVESEVPGAEKIETSAGAGAGNFVIAKPTSTKMDDRNVPAAIVELLAGSKSLGTWFLSSQLRKQSFTHEGKTYDLALRFRRHYTPYSLTLLECSHDIYKGTEIAKNFSSRIRVENPENKESREVLIYMNNPLRYAGTTFYQFQMSLPGQPKSSTFQVVKNPSWLTPYFSCAMVGAGMAVQFLTHLFSFIKRRIS